MIRKRGLGLLLALAVLLGMGWCVSLVLRQLGAQASSLANCEDDGLGQWKRILREFVAGHGGKLPSPAQREALAVRHLRISVPMRCDTGARYQWDDSIPRTSPVHVYPLAWCGKPHGLYRRWRNVLFSNPEMRRVEEGEFEQMDKAKRPR